MTAPDQPPAPGAGADPARLRRIAAASLIGNVLEWFDFAAYGYFAAVIGQQFFPAEDPALSLLASLGVFAAGFLARPAGGALFGHVADRVGRGPALLASVMLMAGATFAMGLLPTYAQIGIAAPVLLVLVRLLQGASVGGEYTTSIIYAVEQAPPGRRGLVASVASLGASGGTLLGSGIGALLTAVLPADSLAAWGWRVPFLLGILLGVVGFLVRRRLTEAATLPAPAAGLDGLPILAAIRTEWPALLRMIGITCLAGVGFYLLFVYSVTYLSTVLHHQLRQSFDINSLAMAVMLVVTPAGGLLSDRFGRRPVLGGSAVLLLLLAWPLLRAMHSADPFVVLLAQCGLALVLGPLIGTVPGTIAEAFPRPLRASAAALAHNVGMGVMGGVSPMLATWLILRTGQDMVPAGLVMLAAAAALAAIATMPETARRPLR